MLKTGQPLRVALTIATGEYDENHNPIYITRTTGGLAIEETADTAVIGYIDPRLEVVAKTGNRTSAWAYGHFKRNPGVEPQPGTYQVLTEEIVVEEPAPSLAEE